MTESILMDFFCYSLCACIYKWSLHLWIAAATFSKLRKWKKKSKTEKKTHIHKHKPLVTCIARYATNEISWFKWEAWKNFKSVHKIHFMSKNAFVLKCSNEIVFTWTIQVNSGINNEVNSKPNHPHFHLHFEHPNDVEMLDAFQRNRNRKRQKKRN